MRAVIDAAALKPFTRALTCLLKYGDDLTIYAAPDSLSLSATNSSLSAYSRFRYERQFFVNYSVGEKRVNSGSFARDVEEVQIVTGQLLTKSLLSVLRNRTVDKTVNRCELSIIEGGAESEDNEDQDSLESKLIVRLHCEHGIVKTHRLLLLTPTSLMAPGVPNDPTESKIMIGPRMLKEMIEHFGTSRSSKNDPQLIWCFDSSELRVGNLESSLNAKGNAQMSTDITLGADGFDVYDIYLTPTTLVFHLREFNATVAYAESMSLDMEMKFTDPAAPLFINIESDSIEGLFVVSTSHAPGASTAGRGTSQARSTTDASVSQTRKRAREDDQDSRENRVPERRRPMKVVERTDTAGLAKAMGEMRSSDRAQSRASGSMPPPSMPPPPSSIPPLPSMPRWSQESHYQAPSQWSQPSGSQRKGEPLFLPSSQMSAADEEALRASGLGIDGMDADEFHAMMEDEGEEVEFDDRRVLPPESLNGDDEVENGGFDHDSVSLKSDEIGPTQELEEYKSFRPLFDD